MSAREKYESLCSAGAPTFCQIVPLQVVVIACTNRPQALDPALRRPGRLDRWGEFPLLPFFASSVAESLSVLRSDFPMNP